MRTMAKKRKPAGQFTVESIVEREIHMKPSIFSTGLASVVLGAALVAWGFFGIVPSPTYIGSGVAVGLTGVGLLLRARVAHSVGLLLAAGATGLGGWNFYRALEQSQHVAMIKAGVLVAVGLYFLVSLTLLRAHFRPAKI
jgi:hypothetical protein